MKNGNRTCSQFVKREEISLSKVKKGIPFTQCRKVNVICCCNTISTKQGFNRKKFIATYTHAHTNRHNNNHIQKYTVFHVVIRFKQACYTTACAAFVIIQACAVVTVGIASKTKCTKSTMTQYAAFPSAPLNQDLVPFG